jgi:hypothetical protein
MPMPTETLCALANDAQNMQTTSKPAILRNFMIGTSF